MRNCTSNISGNEIDLMTVGKIMELNSHNHEFDDGNVDNYGLMDGNDQTANDDVE